MERRFDLGCVVVLLISTPINRDKFCECIDNHEEFSVSLIGISADKPALTALIVDTIASNAIRFFENSDDVVPEDATLREPLAKMKRQPILALIDQIANLLKGFAFIFGHPSKYT